MQIDSPFSIVQNNTVREAAAYLDARPTSSARCAGVRCGAAVEDVPARFGRFTTYVPRLHMTMNRDEEPEQKSLPAPKKHAA
jgi:hypothetical protein